MDVVFIRKMEISTLIGAYDWERQVKQIVVVNMEMASDVKRAAANDALSDALNYSEVSKRVKEFIGSSEFQLVETLAERTAEVVMKEFGVPWLRLELIKPRPLSGHHTVGVVIERGSRVASL